jgi:hypothetical protein
MSPTVDQSVAHVRVQRNGALVTISLAGHLDANTGVELLASLQAELDAGADRVDIDLLAVDGWNPEGARALRRCRRLARGRGLEDGLHYRTGPGAGHEALLDAYGDLDEHDDESLPFGDNALPDAS